MDFYPNAIFCFWGLALLTGSACRYVAVRTINEIGIKSRYYPKYYCSIPKWMKILFKIQQHKIPRYFYVELLISLLFFFLGAINTLIWMVANHAIDVFNILFMCHFCFFLIVEILSSIMSFLYQRK